MSSDNNEEQIKTNVISKEKTDLLNIKAEYKASRRENKLALKTIKMKIKSERAHYKKSVKIIKRDAMLNCNKPQDVNNIDAAQERIENKELDSNPSMVGINHYSGDFTTCLSGNQAAYLRKMNNLPRYTHGEEVFNSVTHIVGGGFGIAYLIVGIVCAALYCPSNMKAISIASMAIFGLCAIFLYTMSSIYHALHINKAKKVFQIIDHCTIYVLIFGTYVPICLMELTAIAPYNYVLLGGIFLLAALGVSLNATMMDKFPVKVVSNSLYLVMGWTIICFYPVLLNSLTIPGVWLLIGGGICYTVGAIFYGIGKNVKYFHSIFHLFVNVGTLLQFLSILLYGIIFPGIGLI